MAVYKDSTFLIECDRPHFDTRFAPGTTVSASGIYRCTWCGQETAAGIGQLLPGHDQHSHPFEFGPACWQLIVLAQ